ncbi:MAG: DNA-3-methyladenine glycosylase I [Promethearchaeota archaeon]|jgi:DNA-3-methyladenine glycosylase I
MVNRCKWGGDDREMINYHDKEWGIPIHDDRLLFEFLTLEGAQAGLSWSTILNKRDNYRKAFDKFDYTKISQYNEDKIEELMNNEGIIRNRRKVEAIISNAKAFLKVQEEAGSFDKYIWKFVNNQPIINKFKNLSELPSKTEISEQMCKELKDKGFKFVGPTICYAFMQAVGMVNDHTIDCFRYEEINRLTV